MMKDSIFSDQEYSEMLAGFVSEALDLLQQIDRDLTALEHNATDPELVHSLFRAFHTVKGVASFFDLPRLIDLTHHVEELLNLARQGKLSISPAVLTFLREASDALEAMVECLSQGNTDLPDPSPLIERARHLCNQSDGSVESPETVDRSGRGASKSKSTSSRTDTGNGQEPVTSAPPLESTVRVDIQRLDRLLNLVGELVLVKNRFSQFLDQLGILEPGNGFMTDLQALNNQFDLITSELQNAIMTTRMLPIGRVFNRFPRLVRELAREFNKEVEVHIEGQDTELDKSVLEVIGDPLVHLVRNCIDHGIEPPEERQRKGKPTRGRISLTARHEGNYVLIEVADDGRGINPAVLKEKAMEKGLITSDMAAQMSTSDAYNLIFRPGFSTSEQVNQISGRGVGMDVVKTNVSRLNGMIMVQSAVGKGTRFTLKLPLTLAIIQCLIIGVGEQQFALPLSSVLEITRVQRRELSQVHNRQVFNRHGSIVPLIRLSEVFDLEDATRSKDQFYTLLLGMPGHAIGLAVEKIYGQKECVVKPLGPMLSQIQGLGGSTILGDGTVVMILDIGEIINMLKLNAVEFSG